MWTPGPPPPPSSPCPFLLLKAHDGALTLRPATAAPTLLPPLAPAAAPQPPGVAAGAPAAPSAVGVSSQSGLSPWQAAMMPMPLVRPSRNTNLWGGDEASQALQVVGCMQH